MKTRREPNLPWDFPKVVFRVFLVFLLLLFGQFTYLSLSPDIYGINMDDFAANRDTVKRVLKATRGTIYDVNSNVLALNVSSYTVIAYLDSSRTGDSEVPLHVVDPKMTAEKLSPILKMTKEALESLLTRDAFQVELGPGGRGITELEKTQIEELGLPGIDFVESSKRYYPNGDFASYVLGYAVSNDKTYEDPDLGKVTETEITGELGLEVMYDELLKGTDGKLIYQQDRFGYKIPDTKEIRIEPKNGDNIYLTIDSAIQRFVEGAVKDNSAIYSPEWMQLTVMEAKTGRILGTSSTPSFNPNIKNITNYENPLVSYLYEPGSVMKIYTYMCAMEKGTYDGNIKYHSGSIKIGTDTINDWDPDGWGEITLDKGFEYSSNVGVSHMLQTILNKNDLRECLGKYGFEEKTGIELPREFVGSLKFTYPIEVAAAGFGQGITTTAIQQLQGLTMIANNGRMVKPHIVDKIVDANTKEIVYESILEKSDPIIKTSTVQKMKDLMYNVIHGTDAGTTGRSYQIKGFDIIGKTGTGQIYDPATGKYLHGSSDYIYSFGGMFPKEDPEIIIYAAMRRPKYGTNKALSNAVKSVMESVAKYKNMFSEVTDKESTNKIVVDSYLSKQTSVVKKELSSQKVDVVVLGNGDKVISQYPAANTTILSHDKVFLLTNDSKITMPSLVGYSKKEAMALLDLLKLKYTMQGLGYVKTQSLKAGTVIQGNELVTLTLAEKFQIVDPNAKKEQNDSKKTS